MKKRSTGHSKAGDDSKLRMTYPVLFLSSHAGKTPWRYVQEQMKSKTTRRKVWNLRMPNMIVLRYI